MTQPWNSLPIRLGVDELHQNQKERATQLFHPMSSPLKRSSQYHHKATPRGTGRRNKHDQMREVRHRFRNDRLVLQREKTTDVENYEKHVRELDPASQEVDLSVLLAEEEENEEGKYEAELEEYLVEAELELAQQLQDMQL